MTAYFPSHSYTTSAYGQPAYGMAGSYVAPGAMYVPAYTLSSSTPPYGHDYYSAPQVLSGVPTVAAPGPMYVPTSVPSYVSSHHGHGHRRHRRHSYPYHQYSYSAAPVIMQPSYNAYMPYNPHSWSHRVRRFFGLAPDTGVRYRNNRSTWGFMGYSRRQRYVDVRTGTEVDRKGRPVFRL